MNIAELAQDRIQKSIFEALRLAAVAEGYLPDILNYSTTTSNGKEQWSNDLQTIANIKNFAVEVFGASSPQSKGVKYVPRISILPGKFTEGEIGYPMEGIYVKNPNNPNHTVNLTGALEATTLNFEVTLTSGTSKQDVVLHALMYKALGAKRFIQYYDNPEHRFFIKQNGYYESSDLPEGVIEKVYLYQISDIYSYGEVSTNIPLISEITLDMLLDDSGQPLQNVNPMGPYINGGGLFINLSGINFT